MDNTDYRKILPSEVFLSSLKYLNNGDLLYHAPKYNLDNSFWTSKLNMDFSDKEIIDMENVDLVYWYYSYIRINEEWKENKGSIVHLTQQFGDKSITYKSVLNLIEKLTDYTKIIEKEEILLTKIKEYIINERIKRYKTWPKCLDIHDKEEQRYLDARFIGSFNYNIRLENEYIKLVDIDINLFKGKFNNINKGLVLSYIYLEELYYYVKLKSNTNEVQNNTITYTHIVPVPPGTQYITAFVSSGN